MTDHVAIRAPEGSGSVRPSSRPSTHRLGPNPPRRLLPLLQAALGGLLVALALPPWGIWPLAFVGIALFEVSLGEAPTRRQRAARAALFGAAWLYPGMCWMWFLTAPGYLVAAGIFAGYHVVAALLAPGGPWRVIGRPAAHTLAEALRFCFPFGGVPIATLPIGQAGGPLLGVARVGGAVLLTWVTFQIGFALAGPSPFVPQFARTRGAKARGQWHGVAGFAAVATVLGLAAVAPHGASTGRTLRIAGVQGGGPQGTRAIDTDPRVVFDRHLAADRTIAPGSVDLVVWPENVVDVASFAASRELVEIAAEAKRIGAPIAVGITEDAPVDRFRNAEVIVTPDGAVTSRYEKVRRVPFGEYVPLRGLLDAVGAPTDLVPRDAVAGHGPAYLDLPDGTRVGVAISWEIFFGGRGRDGTGHGAALILNPTNGSSYTGTVLQTQQVASSRLRAVENGRSVVQVSPTGFSAFVTPSGAVVDRTGVGEQRVIVGQIDLRDGRTWYSRIGDVALVIVALAVLVGSWLADRRRHGEGQPAATPT